MLNNDIVFLGDVMLGENLFHLGRGISSIYDNSYERIIPKNLMKIFLENSKCLFYNFEYSLFDNIQSDHSVLDLVYRANISSLSLFPCEQLKIVNIANNHFAEHGKYWCDYTISKLMNYGFVVIGEKLEPKIIKCAEKTIIFYGVSLIKDSKYTGTYSYNNSGNLINDIKQSMPPQKNVVKIISIHWGDEYISYPSQKQINLGHELIDLGFDIVIGHHPHVIQGFESYKNKLIFYSLGNFIFDQNFSAKTSEGLILRLNFDDLTNFELFVSKQNKKHKIISIKKISNEKYLINNNNKKWNDILIKITKFKYNLLMKVEYILNIHKTNKDVFRFLVQKILKRN